MSWVLLRTPFYRKSGIPSVWLLAIFILKILAGGFYGYFFTKMPDYAQNADTWRIHFAGIEENKWLLRDPIGFAADLVNNRYTNDTGILGTQNSLLNDLKDVLMVKLAAVLDLFSGGRYYVNLIFFEYLTLFGQVALGIAWAKIFKMSTANWLVPLVCLWPSVLFWGSGFHRDGLLLHATGWIAASVYFFHSSNKKFWLLAGIFIHLLLVFMLRNYAVVMLAAGFAAGFIYKQWPKKRKILMPAFAAAAAILFIGSGHWFAGPDLLQAISHRRDEFLTLKGASLITTEHLQPTPQGFLLLLPQSLQHALLRPWIWEANKLTYFPAAIENCLFILLSAMCIIKVAKKQWQPMQPFEIAAIVIAIGFILIIGYTVPFLTAIVRYKSLMWPFLLPVLAYHSGLLQHFCIIKKE